MCSCFSSLSKRVHWVPVRGSCSASLPPRPCTSASSFSFSDGEPTVSPQTTKNNWFKAFNTYSTSFIECTVLFRFVLRTWNYTGLNFRIECNKLKIIIINLAEKILKNENFQHWIYNSFVVHLIVNFEIGKIGVNIRTYLQRACTRATGTSSWAEYAAQKYLSRVHLAGSLDFSTLTLFPSRGCIFRVEFSSF